MDFSDISPGWGGLFSGVDIPFPLQLCVVDNFRVVTIQRVPLKVVSVDKGVVDGLEQHCTSGPFKL